MDTTSLEFLMNDTLLDTWINQSVTNDNFVVSQHNIDDTYHNIPTPKMSKTTKNLSPIVLMNVRKVNKQFMTQLLIVLCDSRSSDSLMRRSALPF